MRRSSVSLPARSATLAITSTSGSLSASERDLEHVVGHRATALEHLRTGPGVVEHAHLQRVDVDAAGDVDRADPQRGDAVAVDQRRQGQGRPLGVGALLGAPWRADLDPAGEQAELLGGDVGRMVGAEVEVAILGARSRRSKVASVLPSVRCRRPSSTAGCRGH